VDFTRSKRQKQASAAGKILRAAFGVAVLEAEGSVPEQRQG
jgi:hypothetical protein